MRQGVGGGNVRRVGELERKAMLILCQIPCQSETKEKH